MLLDRHLDEPIQLEARKYFNARAAMMINKIVFIKNHLKAHIQSPYLEL